MRWFTARAVPIGHTGGIHGTRASKERPRSGKLPQGRVLRRLDRRTEQHWPSLLPGPVTNCPLHERYLGGGTNVENMVQTQCGCREPTNTYFLCLFSVGAQHHCKPTECSASQGENTTPPTPHFSQNKNSTGVAVGTWTPSPRRMTKDKTKGWRNPERKCNFPEIGP